MASGVFNISKGEVNEKFNRVANNDPANSAIVLVFLQVAEADATLEDYDDLDALLVAAGNTEATFTNYARKVLTDATVAAAIVDDTNNWKYSDLPDQTWTSAGGATNNSLVKLLVCYDNDTTAGTDANIVPLCHLDAVATTDGNDLNVVFSANGVFRAT